MSSLPSTLQMRVVVPFPTMETRPLLSTVATAELAVDQEGVDVVPDTLICTVVPLGMVKSVLFSTGLLVEVDVPGVEEGAVLAPAPAGASKLHRTMQVWKICVPLRVAVMVTLLTPPDLPSPLTCLLYTSDAADD